MGGQTGGNVVPDLGERIGARAPGMRRVRLTGQLPRAAVLARRLFIHARLGGSQSQSSFGVAQRQKPPHLLICDHSSLLAMDWNKSIRCKPAGVLIVVWAEIYLSLFRPVLYRPQGHRPVSASDTGSHRAVGVGLAGLWLSAPGHRPGLRLRRAHGGPLAEEGGKTLPDRAGTPGPRPAPRSGGRPS